MPVLTDGFELATETQVTLIVRGTYNSGEAAYLQIVVTNEVTHGSTQVSFVNIESSTPDVALAGFSLRLGAGRYNWQATLDSRIADGMVKGKLYRDYFLIHDELHGGLPFGTIGRVSCRGNKHAWFCFSGISSRKISVDGTVNGEQSITGNGGVLNMTTNKLLSSPLLSSANNLNNGVWTAFSNLSINNKQVYKVIFFGTSSTSKPVSISFSLQDTT